MTELEKQLSQALTALSKQYAADMQLLRQDIERLQADMQQFKTLAASYKQLADQVSSLPR